jgi:hypothetical protein
MTAVSGVKPNAPGDTTRHALGIVSAFLKDMLQVFRTLTSHL